MQLVILPDLILQCEDRATLGRELVHRVLTYQGLPQCPLAPVYKGGEEAANLEGCTMGGVLLGLLVLVGFPLPFPEWERGKGEGVGEGKGVPPPPLVQFGLPWG